MWLGLWVIWLQSLLEQEGKPLALMCSLFKLSCSRMPYYHAQTSHDIAFSATWWWREEKKQTFLQYDLLSI